MDPNPAPPFSIVDLHSHLVPGVDDGTRTVAESIQALSDLYDEGVRTVVTTPHLLLPHLSSDNAIDRELDRHRRAFDMLIRACEGQRLPKLYLGQEIWAPEASVIRRAVRRTDIGLPGRFLLIEFGFDLQGNHNDVIREVLDAGRQIVVAHPERYRFLPGHEPLEVMRTWQEFGALLQVNVGSLTGHYESSSPGAELLAWEMIGLGVADILATDHHGPRRPGVSSGEALKTLTARGELAFARRAMGEIPARIVRDDLVVSRLPG